MSRILDIAPQALLLRPSCGHHQRKRRSFELRLIFSSN